MSTRQFYQVIKQNIQLSQLSQNQMAEIQEELWQNGVILLQNQDLQPNQLSQFTAQFGQQIILHPDLAFGNQIKQFPAVTQIGNVKNDGTFIENVQAAQYWHQDGDFWQPGENFIINFLYGIEIPQVGGNTGFKDTQTALQRLDKSLVQKLTGAYVEVKAREIKDFQKAGQENIPPDAQHNVVFEHPFNKKPQLYALTPIPGMNMICRDGSTYAFSDLHEQISQVVETVEHKWEVGDLIIWDNLQCIHRSMGGYGNNRRKLWRAQSRIKY